MYGGKTAREGAYRSRQKSDHVLNKHASLLEEQNAREGACRSQTKCYIKRCRCWQSKKCEGAYICLAKFYIIM